MSATPNYPVEMNVKRAVRKALMSVLAGALYCTAAPAFAEVEVEPNNPIGSAQPITADAAGTAVVDGVVGSANGNDAPIDDTDFYVFQGAAGDIVTVDINNGTKTDGTRSVDTLIALFDSTGTVLMQNDQEADGINDSLIASFPLPHTGTYVVGVTSANADEFGVWREFTNGGALTSAMTATTATDTSNGSYELVISGVTSGVTLISSTTTTTVDPAPTTTTTTVDPAPTTTTTTTQDPAPTTSTSTTTVAQDPVAQDPTEPQSINLTVMLGFRNNYARINPTSRGNIPVALLGSSTFNVRRIDTQSITFGATGDENSLLRCNPKTADVNGDRYADLQCHFDTQKSGFSRGDMEANVRGKMLATPGSGVQAEFEGKGYIKTLPLTTAEKKASNRHSRRNQNGRR